MRLSRPELFMEQALLTAKRSTCFRLNVGCVIVDQRIKSIISTGYNGPPAGEAHCQGGTCAGKNGCFRAIHAEINAIDKVPGHPPSWTLDIYTTHSPCVTCWNTIRESRMFGRLFFQTEYRHADHLTSTPDLGVYKVTPAGYITRFGEDHVFDPEVFYAS